MVTEPTSRFSFDFARSLPPDFLTCCNIKDFRSDMLVIQAVADIFDGNLVAGALLTLEVVA